MFLSIFAATCRPHNIIGFLDNLAETADDVSSFEVLLKLDEGADDLMALIEDYKKRAKFTVKYLATPVLDGYYSLDVGYNELLKIADPDTYFCWLLTDEIRFAKKGWDSVLKRYIGFYPDDIFRIKLSIFQLKNYNDFFECLPAPDNYAVTTRKWLEITGGWGNFWGPDSWHQCVDFFLGLCKNKDNPYGTWRSFPIYDIVVEGQEAGQGITDPAKERERAYRIHHGWKKHSSHAAQENFYKLALQLNAHIVAHANKMERYIIEDHLTKKTVSLYDLNNTLLTTSSYRLPRIKIQFMIGLKRMSARTLFPALYFMGRKAKGAYKKMGLLFSNITTYVIKFPLLLKNWITFVIYRLLKLIANLFGIAPFARKMLTKAGFKKNDNKKIIYLYDGKKFERVT